MSTGVSAQSSAGSSGETKSKTLARRATVEKTTGSRKRAKGAPIVLTTGAGENTMSQDRENLLHLSRNSLYSVNPEFQSTAGSQ